MVESQSDAILAGADMATLKSYFTRARAIVRVMPNLPVAVRRGVLPLFCSDPALQSELQPWFSMLGFAPWCLTEEEFGAIGFVAGVSFSAPATSVPLPVFVGLLAGVTVGYVLYKLSFHLFPP